MSCVCTNNSNAPRPTPERMRPSLVIVHRSGDEGNRVDHLPDPEGGRGEGSGGAEDGTSGRPRYLLINVWKEEKARQGRKDEPKRERREWRAGRAGLGKGKGKGSPALRSAE